MLIAADTPTITAAYRKHLPFEVDAGDVDESKFSEMREYCSANLGQEMFELSMGPSWQISFEVNDETSRWDYLNNTFYFAREVDAVEFKLRCF
jgi:hypothetical protein